MHLTKMKMKDKIEMEADRVVYGSHLPASRGHG